jgi:hypothetical protein
MVSIMHAPVAVTIEALEQHTQLIRGVDISAQLAQDLHELCVLDGAVAIGVVPREQRLNLRLRRCLEQERAPHRPNAP